MELKKGMLIKMTRTNPGELFKNTSANIELVYRVDRVNKKSYSLTCVDGFMKNTGCKLLKSFPAVSRDEYGTVTKYEVV